MPLATDPFNALILEMNVYMFTVAQLANLSDSTSHAVRYYTKIGLLRPQKNSGNGYRLYAEKEVSWLRFVRQAKSLGYTLKEIKNIMHDVNSNTSPCPKVREIILKRINENRRNLDELVALQTRMEQALAIWETMPDGVPDGSSVCHLIESIVDENNYGHAERTP